MNKVKFLVFSDLHLGDHYAHNTTEHLDDILKRAKENEVDFIIHCGDFGLFKSYPEELNKYNNFEIPTYHVIGNHDTYVPLEEAMQEFQMANPYYFFDRNGFRFIALDSNGMRIDGEDILFSNGNNRGKSDYFPFLTQEQLDWMEQTILESPYPVVVFSHHSLSCDDYGKGGGLKNREDILEMFQRVKAQGKSVLMALSGHYHVDHLRILEHTCYFEVNSATMFYNPEEHELFPQEYIDAHPGSRHCAIYDDALSAIVTITDDGTIEIDGVESSFFMGVSRMEIAGMDYFNEYGKKVTSSIKSEKLILPL